MTSTYSCLATASWGEMPVLLTQRGSWELEGTPLRHFFPISSGFKRGYIAVGWALAHLCRKAG